MLAKTPHDHDRCERDDQHGYDPVGGRMRPDPSEGRSEKEKKRSHRAVNGTKNGSDNAEAVGIDTKWRGVA